MDVSSAWREATIGRTVPHVFMPDDAEVLHQTPVASDSQAVLAVLGRDERTGSVSRMRPARPRRLSAAR